MSWRRSFNNLRPLDLQDLRFYRVNEDVWRVLQLAFNPAIGARNQHRLVLELRCRVHHRALALLVLLRYLIGIGRSE